MSATSFEHTSFDGESRLAAARHQLELVEAALLTLAEEVGAGAVVDNLASTLSAVFTPAASMVIAELLADRVLRDAVAPDGIAGVPIVSHARAAVSAYLSAEQRAGRISREADAETLAGRLVGAAHLLFARPLPRGPLDPFAVEESVTAILGDRVIGEDDA